MLMLMSSLHDEVTGENKEHKGVALVAGLIVMGLVLLFGA